MQEEADGNKPSIKFHNLRVQERMAVLTDRATVFIQPFRYLFGPF